MTKTIIFFLAVIILCSSSDPLQEIRSIVERDECGTNGLSTLRPEMENQMALLK